MPMVPAPSPCSSRPTISCGMVGAVAATTRPTVNSANPPAIGRAGPNRSHSRPAATVAKSCPMRNSENAHAYRCSPSRARAAAGIAVATEIDSNAIAVTVMQRAVTVSARRRLADTPPRRVDVETLMPVAKHHPQKGWATGRPRASTSVRRGGPSPVHQDHDGPGQASDEDQHAVDDRDRDALLGAEPGGAEGP